MAEREKSALYPNMTWEECLEFVNIVDSFKLKAVSYSEVAKKLGLSSTQTKSFTAKISSSKQFGLITTSNNTIQLTETCKRILYPTGGDVYLVKHACFALPPLYNKLIALYDGKALPNITILGNILMTDHKIAKAVKDTAAKCFLQSAEQLNLIQGGILCYSQSDQYEENCVEDIPKDEESKDVAHTDVHTVQPIGNESDYITQSIPTQSGKIAKIIIPIDAAPDDLYMIKDMLDIVLKRKFKLSDI